MGTKRRVRFALSILTVCLVLVSAVNVIHAPFARAGAALYPDLQTAPPGRLDSERSSPVSTPVVFRNSRRNGLSIVMAFPRSIGRSLFHSSRALGKQPPALYPPASRNATLAFLHKNNHGSSHVRR